jgi:hypothetical protein
VWTCCVVVVFVFVIVLVVALCQPLTHQFYHSFTQTASNKVPGVKTQLVDGPDIMPKGDNENGSNKSALPEPEAHPEVSGTSDSAPEVLPGPGPDGSKETDDAGEEPPKASVSAPKELLGPSSDDSKEIEDAGEEPLKPSVSAPEEVPGPGPSKGPAPPAEGGSDLSEPKGPLGRAL